MSKYGRELIKHIWDKRNINKLHQHLLGMVEEEKTEEMTHKASQGE
jgi:hypothetical protein